MLLISSQVTKNIIFAINAPPDRTDEAREEIKKSRERVDQFIKQEQERLCKIFPSDDSTQHVSQRRGCCGQ